MKRVGIIFAAVALICFIGCGEYYETLDMDSVSNGKGETLTLMANPDNINIAADGMVTVQTILTDINGKGIESGTVYLTSTMGALGDNVLTTDSSGTSVTTLAASTIEGYAVVVATYGGMNATVTVSMFYDGNNAGAGSDGTSFDDGTGTGTDTGTGA